MFPPSLLGSFCTVALLAAFAAPAQERPARLVPVLGKEPKLDGALGDLAAGLTLRPAENDEVTSTFVAKAGFRKNTLFLGVEVTDDTLTAGDLMRVTLHFANAGATARAYTFRFALDGMRAPEAEVGAPLFANALVRAAVKRSNQGMTVEAAFPPRSLPRFPARDPLVVDLCLSYEDLDAVAATPANLSTCSGGSMISGPLKLPDELRRGLNLRVPQEVDALEARENAWLGFAALRYPKWISADAELTPDGLCALATETPIDADDARIPVPKQMALKDGRPLWPVLSGKDPYAAEGECNAEDELRLGLYAVKGKLAYRALEWPAATCALGRAVSFAFGDDGSLTIGYANGSTSTFAWSTDHFERTELGAR